MDMGSSFLLYLISLLFPTPMLKEAAEFLKTIEYPYGFPAIKKATIDGNLRVRLGTSPIEHYTMAKADLIVWASDPEQHKPGRKTE